MIFKFVLFALGTTFILVILKENSPPMAVAFSIAACTAMLMLSSKLFPVIKNLVAASGLPSGVTMEGVSVIAKTLAMAYLTSFGSDICMDSGAKAIANALETAGKLIMLSMAFPMLEGIFKSVVAIIG